MNITAERIEQLIQLVNRNLSLVFAGQVEGVTPLEPRRLQKVDTVIFGHDKFAYEMVHFLASATDKLVFDKSVFAAWESNFIKGLEALLVECAVIHDDIERDCFISRVYCWFTEKLAERREVPRHVKVGVDELRSSVSRTMGGTGGDTTHTMRALNTFHPEDTVDIHQRLMADPAAAHPHGDHGHGHTDHLPPINGGLGGSSFPAPKARTNRFGARKVPLYVKHAYPSVLPPAGSSTALPKIPGAEDNYGMLYNKPETAAEKTMQELWLARRQQEAFQHKTQQQLALVMDRLALHRSRLESDALRRQESEQMLKAVQAHQLEQQNNQQHQSKRKGHKDDTDGAAQAAPPGRPHRSLGERLRAGFYDDHSPLSSPESRRRATRSHSPPKSTALMMAGPQSSVDIEGGAGGEVSVAAPARIAVTKKDMAGTGAKSRPTPMRFKIDLPADYMQRQQFYLQVSDDEDEEDDEAQRVIRPVPPPSSKAKSAGKGAGKGGAGKAGEVLFKRDRVEMRERPVSASLLRGVVATDNEFKVHYRHTNYRRMPMTGAQQAWLDEREIQRKVKSETMARELAAAGNAKGKKDDKKDKGKKDDKKDKGKKDAKKGSRPTTGDDDTDKPKLKYKSANHFMASHFPNFEDEEDLDTMAPMRALQLAEVGDIMETFAQYHVPVKESALRKALVIPMDKPEAVCLEGLREDKEGLMINPLPPDRWRVFKMGKGKKGKGKKKKKA